MVTNSSAYCVAHRGLTAAHIRWRKKNPEKWNALTRRAYQKTRRLALENYSDGTPTCACCGETEYVFLALDHVNGGGNAHRRALSAQPGGCGYVYTNLRKQNWPDGFQVLCHNCNFAKSHGGCPHKPVEEYVEHENPDSPDLDVQPTS